jgi:hypothetical protein
MTGGVAWIPCFFLAEHGSRQSALGGRQQRRVGPELRDGQGRRCNCDCEWRTHANDLSSAERRVKICSGTEVPTARVLSKILSFALTCMAMAMAAKLELEKDTGPVLGGER